MDIYQKMPKASHPREIWKYIRLKNLYYKFEL